MHETTGNLFHKLRGSESGMTFLQENRRSPVFSKVLRDLLDQEGLSAPEWMAAANLSKSYGYQILRGERTPGRDVLLRTALVLRLTLQETQRLLAVGGCGALYPRVRRDAAVVFALNQRMTLLEAEELLASLPERSLHAGEN